MGDSLLWLIHKEDYLMADIKRLEDRLKDCRHDLFRAEAYPYNCDARDAEIDRCTKYVAETQKELDEKRAELSVTRADLGRHIKELIEEANVDIGNEQEV